MVIIYILNAIVNAVLFGVFVDQFEIVRRKETSFQREVDESNTVMGLVNMPRILKDDVRGYLARTFTTKNQ